jgi:hypothetical protein
MRDIRNAAVLAFPLCVLLYLIQWKSKAMQVVWISLFILGRDAHSPNFIQGVLLMYFICWVVAFGLIRFFRFRQSKRGSAKL